jgi:hypothetical protein
MDGAFHPDYNALTPDTIGTWEAIDIDNVFSPLPILGEEPQALMSMISDLGDMGAEKWLPSSIMAKHINELMTDGLILADHVLHAYPGSRQSELGYEETVILLDHLFCGVGFPLSKFSPDVLEYFKIQLIDLAPNSVTFMSIFAHLCRVFLEIEHTLDLFLQFFQLTIKPRTG